MKGKGKVKGAAGDGDHVTFTVRVRKELHRALWSLSVPEGGGKRKTLQALVAEAIEAYVRKR